FAKIPGEANFYTDLWWWIGHDADPSSRGKSAQRGRQHARFMHSFGARETARSLMQSGLNLGRCSTTHPKPPPQKTAWLHIPVRGPRHAVSAGGCRRQSGNSVKASLEAQQLLKGGERWRASCKTRQ